MASVESWVVYTYYRKDPKPLHEKQVWPMYFTATTEEEAIRHAQLNHDYEPVLAELTGTRTYYRRHNTAKSESGFNRWRLNTLLEERRLADPPLPKVVEAVKPVGVPPEVHATAKFDPALAWRATRIAAGDPPPGE